MLNNIVKPTQYARSVHQLDISLYFEQYPEAGMKKKGLNSNPTRLCFTMNSYSEEWNIVN